MQFLDITKIFDWVQLQGILNITQKREISYNIIEVTKYLNKESETKIKVGGELIGERTTQKGIRHGYSLRPLLFNSLTDKIFEGVNQLPGYQFGNKNIKNVLYNDDAVVVLGMEDKWRLYCIN